MKYLLVCLCTLVVCSCATRTYEYHDTQTVPTAVVAPAPDVIVY